MFKDAEGKISNLRVMSFMSLIYLFFVGAWQMATHEIHFEMQVLLACCAFAPKVVQKFAERRI